MRAKIISMCLTSLFLKKKTYENERWVQFCKKIKKAIVEENKKIS